MPSAGPDDVLIRIKRVGVRGTDLHIFTGNQPYLAYPRVMGHELAGIELRDDLETLWCDEVLPVFDALGQGYEARAYLDDVRERFDNPFLDHRLADIARNHEQKKERRFRPVIEFARDLELAIDQPRLSAALG